MSDPILSVGRRSPRTTVLGPGVRAVIWVRGCPLRCEGCVAPQDLPFEGGEPWPVEDLAAWLNGLPADVTGLTFSGGEPMAQAAGLSALVERARAGRDWSVLSYSGYTIEHLRRHGDAAQHRLLGQLDILIDGPYLRRHHGDLLWRGSANQRVHLLTGRHTRPERDRSAGIELHVDDGGVHWIGVPPVPDFRTGFEDAMRARGIHLGPDPDDRELGGAGDVG
jgi:anaerobic ribonucleoside-triphosphate reductase activating protein